MQSFHRVELEDATLLGAPPFPGAALDTAWDDRCKDLDRAVVRIKTINSQDALILLRSSFSAPRVLDLLPCSPGDYPSLIKFDGLLRDSVQQITNSAIRDRGLRIKRVTSLALPAFVAYAASTLSLQADILADCVVSDSNFHHLYLTRWSTQFGDLPEVANETALLGLSRCVVL